MNRRRQSLCALLVFWFSGLNAAADDRAASSIPEFVAAKDRWSNLVGRPMRLEGRFTVFGSSDLRFRNCDMNFILAKSFRRPPSGTKNVEVAGQIARKDGELIFRVTELIPRESDEELLTLKRSLVNSSVPEEILELGNWARDRGRFYDDDTLRAAANKLYREGLTIAEEHLKPDDAEGRRALARNAKEFGLEPSVGLRYLHSALRLEWEAARAAQTKEYRRILTAIRRDLPGASTPLPADRLALRKDYSQAPLAVYRVADDPTRRLLDRAFYLEVGLANILLSAEPDGRNGYAIAKRVEQELPELKKLADTYRQQELASMSSGVSRLTRAQMVELSQRYKDRGDEKQATDVIRSWLKAREAQATANGPTELMDLGDEYINLLNDEPSAARMYQSAHRQNPQLPTPAEWLAARGYELNDADWSKPGEASSGIDKAAIDLAIQEGRVEVGMSGEQVLKALGTKPTSMLRMISAGQLAEVWLFSDYGISVRLTRISHTEASQVVQVDAVD